MYQRGGYKQMTLLDKLIEKQLELKLSDQRFADRLGISRQLWTKTRQKQTPLGMSVLRGVLREFPSLTDDVLHTVASYKPKVAA
jgi:hypothetical protein